MNKPIFGWQDILAKNGPQVLTNIAQKVGMNKAAANFICEFLRDLGFAHIAKRPGKKLWKGKGKISQKEFVEITRCEWRLNQDERDSGLIVFGLSHLEVESIILNHRGPRRDH